VTVLPLAVSGRMQPTPLLPPPHPETFGRRTPRGSGGLRQNGARTASTKTRRQKNDGPGPGPNGLGGMMTSSRCVRSLRFRAGRCFTAACAAQKRPFRPGPRFRPLRDGYHPLVGCRLYIAFPQWPNRFGDNWIGTVSHGGETQTQYGLRGVGSHNVYSMYH